MYDYYESFDNFEELASAYPELAESLLEDVGEGEWQDEELMLFDDIENFAEYELYDGWYSDIFGDADFNGAPNPLNYIDLAEFGEALSNSWDDSAYWRHGDYIVATPYGW